jgi:hypothetical protein
MFLLEFSKGNHCKIMHYRMFYVLSYNLIESLILFNWKTFVIFLRNFFKCLPPTFHSKFNYYDNIYSFILNNSFSFQNMFAKCKCTFSCSKSYWHNPGGLDSRDQSRSRTSFVSRLTFLNCRDILFFSRSRFLKSRFFSQDFDASRFLRFVKTQSRFVEKSRHCRGLLSLKMMKSLDGLRNLDEKIQKSTHFSIEIETNCQEMPKFSDLDEFLNLDRDFLVWTLMSRLTLWRRRDRESRSRPRGDKSRPPGLYWHSFVVQQNTCFFHQANIISNAF